MEQRPRADRVAAVSALDDPVRRDLFELVTRSDAPVSREAAAGALGLSRSTAAFHLDRLADEGLLAVEYQRLSGRSGPGAGRPAKLYRRAAGELSVTVPERRYDLAAELFAAAVEESIRNGEPVRDALRRLAAASGRDMGTRCATLEEALEASGFEPARAPDDSIWLRNCPFHQLARRHTEIVCDLNLELLTGVAAGVGDDAHAMVLDPAEGRCCVRAVPRATRRPRR